MAFDPSLLEEIDAPAKGFDESLLEPIDQAPASAALQPQVDWRNPKLQSSIAAGEQNLSARQAGYGAPETELLRSVASDPMSFVKSIPDIAMGVASAPGKIAYDTAADVISKVAGQPEYGGNLASRMTGAETTPAEQFIRGAAKTNPNLALAANIGKTLPELASMMAVNPSGAAGRLLAAGFSSDMIAKAKPLFDEYATEINKPPEEQDSGKLNDLKTGVISTFTFAPLAGAHGLGEVPGAVADRVVPARQLAKALNESVSEHPGWSGVDAAAVGSLSPQAAQLTANRLPQAERPIDSVVGYGEQAQNMQMRDDKAKPQTPVAPTVPKTSPDVLPTLEGFSEETIANAGNQRITVQRADGSTYEAVLRGDPGDIGSIGKPKMVKGQPNISHGNLGKGERILTPEEAAKLKGGSTAESPTTALKKVQDIVDLPNDQVAKAKLNQAEIETFGDHLNDPEHLAKAQSALDKLAAEQEALNPSDPKPENIREISQIGTKMNTLGSLIDRAEGRASDNPVASIRAAEKAKQPAAAPAAVETVPGQDHALVRANQVGDAIYLQFDVTAGKVPSATDLTRMFRDAGHNVEFQEFAADPGSTAAGVVKFKGSAMDQSGASSRKSASEAYQKVFGQSEPISSKSQTENKIPALERFKKSLRAYSKSETPVTPHRIDPGQLTERTNTASDWTSATEEGPVTEPSKSRTETPTTAEAGSMAPPKFPNRKMSPLDKATASHSAKLQKSMDEARRAQKEIKREVPSERRQSAISVWREAKGDAETLKTWEASAKGKVFKQAVIDAQTLTPKEIAIANKSRTAFDVLHQRGTKYDVLKSFIEDYVPHVWDVNKPGTGWGGGVLQQRFKFAKARTFQTFFEGDQAGYKPKTLAIGKLLPAYLHEMNKVIADRQFVSEIMKETAKDGAPLGVQRGNVQVVENPEGKAVLVQPRSMREPDTGDYRTMENQPALHDWIWQSKDTDGNPIFVKADIALHPEAYRRLHAMLGQSALRTWYRDPVGGTAQIPRAVARALDAAQSYMKREMFGLLAPFHQVQEGTHAVGHLVNPIGGTRGGRVHELAGKILPKTIIDPLFNIPKVDLRSPGQMDAARHGLMLLPDRASSRSYLEGVGNRSSLLSQGVRKAGKVGETISNAIDVYQDYLFHQYIPGLKYKTYEAMLGRNMKLYAKELASGEMTPADVKITSAEQANAAYGHLNYALLDRNPTIQHLIQITALAPDFLEARARFTGQAIKGFRSKVGHEQLKAIAIIAAAQAGTAYALSNLLGDKYDPKHPFEVIHNGRRYAMRSVPEDIFTVFKDTRQFLYSRVNPLTIKGGIQLATGLNYRGEKTSATDTMTELLAGYIPITARSLPGIRSLTETGRQNPVSPLQQLAGSLGLRISRYSPVSETYKLAGDWMDKQKMPRDRGSYPISKYQQLRYALEDGDIDRARAAYQELKKTMKPDKIRSGFKESVNHPFTGSQANDAKFAKTLTGYELELYNQALRTRRNMLNLYGHATTP